MHENAGNLGYRIPYFKHVINSLGVNILAMAYRGYSYSDQVTPTEAGLKLDAEAILSFLNNPNQTNEKVAELINP